MRLVGAGAVGGAILLGAELAFVAGGVLPRFCRFSRPSWSALVTGFSVSARSVGPVGQLRDSGHRF